DPHRAPRRASEHPLRYSVGHYIPACRQPQTASRQPPRDIGHDGTVGGHREPHQRSLRTHLAGDEAAARGAALFVIVFDALCHHRGYYSFAGSAASAAGSSANQCSRAFMMMALACSSSSLSVVVSAISTSSSPARSARSSSVLTPFSPSATSSEGAMPSSAAISSETPSSCRRASRSAFWVS